MAVCFCSARLFQTGMADYVERNVYITAQNDDMTNHGQCSRSDATARSMSVSIHFALTGSLCYVSHAEMLRVLQRAFARAGIPLAHSHGFNPHPRLSLPLPRSVGVESEDELLHVRIDLGAVSQHQWYLSPSGFDAQRLMRELGGSLPRGCELISAALAESSAPPQPCSAVYVLTLRPERVDHDIEAGVRSISDAESLPVQRRAKGRGWNTRTIDVREFLKSVEFRGQEVVVDCKICPGGSIRIDEILNLLNLDPAALAAPVRRKSVQWLEN